MAEKHPNWAFLASLAIDLHLGHQITPSHLHASVPISETGSMTICIWKMHRWYPSFGSHTQHAGTCGYV